MTINQLTRWLEAFIAMQVWNPELWRWYPNIKVRKRMQLMYRCRGIVLHDRILNGRRAT